MKTNETVASISNIQTGAVTVLTAPGGHMVKSYALNSEGQITSTPYSQESLFSHARYLVDNLDQLAELVKRLSARQDSILIRGAVQSKTTASLRRIKDSFPELDAGCSWLMIDFDNIVLPQGISPTGQEAIEFVIRKLPDEFHGASYFYQFSASAGILRPDGSPLKAGLNVHLFFWLDRSVNGKKLAAYLEQHCIDTEFYDKELDRSGQPMIKLGIDPAVLRSSVQPHYVGLPIIGQGVTCTLANDARQGLVNKAHDSVTLPPMRPDIEATTFAARRKLKDAYNVECGLVERKAVARAVNGTIMVTNYSRKLEGVSPSTNRIFAEARLYGDAAESAILYFEDEHSPGSWYVTKSSPHIARRFGDGSALPLRELSDGAYAHVRDTLKWFSEVVQEDGLALTEQGYLPDIDSFAVARNCLIEAPTGSGKTTAFCRFAGAHRGKIILYAAQTIALVKQMDQDLRQAGIRVVHYREFSNGDDLNPGVYVTTNESLKKFVGVAIDRGIDFILVVDEVHMALDDFMGTETKNRLLERAIGRAERCLFMTATITHLQQTKLLHTISRACGALTASVYAGYRFAPVKTNPLILKPVESLGADFIALLRSYQALKAAGEIIPRTVLIVPTSKMRVFEFALEMFDLFDDAHIASRQEHTQREIEEARVSVRPILIVSPMFALGLNFEAQPARFWTYFSHLNVDTSHIIQTLNRANRGAVVCEVRLYHGHLDDKPFFIPSAMQERLRIENCLSAEASIQGVLDTHFSIDRPMYNALRGAEKVTAKAMGSLVAGDRFQNYRIDRNWQETLVAEKDDHQTFIELRVHARSSYEFDVATKAENLVGETQEELFYRLQKLRAESSTLYANPDGRVERDIESDEHAALMLLCDIEDPKLVKPVVPARICRLFGELRPYLTGQFDAAKTTAWRTAASEKTSALVPLLAQVKKLGDGEIDGIEFAQLMRRPGLREGVKALATSEHNLLQNLEVKLSRLDALLAATATASKNKRGAIRKEQFDIAQQFLATIGVYFKKVKQDDDREVYDPTAPVVPGWDFDAMMFRLQCEAKSIMKLPSADAIKSWEVEMAWRGAPVSAAICESCLHRKPASSCGLGRPVQLPWEGEDGTQDHCDAKAQITIPLAKKRPKETMLRPEKGATPELAVLARPSTAEMRPLPPSV